MEFAFFGFHAIQDGLLIFQLKETYRMKEKLWFDAQLTMPYSRRLDGFIDYRKTDDPKLKLSIDFSPMAHYKLFSKIKSKIKYYAIDYDYEGSDNPNTTNVYKALLPRKKEYALETDLGFNFNRTNSNSFRLSGINHKDDAHYD